MNKNRIIEDYLQGKHPIEQNSWELPSAQELERDEALFESLVPQKKAPKRIKLWPLAVAACVAGFVAIFLVPPRKTNVEPVEQQPVVAEVVEQPAPEAPKDSEYSEVSEKTENSEPSEPVKPKRTHKVRKVQEEPQLAEAETMPEEVETEQKSEYRPTDPDPMLLAAAFAKDVRSRGERLHQEVAQSIKNP